MEKLSLLFLSVMILFISCGSDNENEGNTVDETTTSIISVWESNESVNGNVSVVSFDDKGHYIKLIAKSELFLMSSGNYKIENQSIRFIDEFDNSKNETLDYSIKDNSLMLDGKSYSRVGDPELLFKNTLVGKKYKIGGYTISYAYKNIGECNIYAEFTSNNTLTRSLEKVYYDEPSKNSSNRDYFKYVFYKDYLYIALEESSVAYKYTLEIYSSKGAYIYYYDSDGKQQYF